MGAFRVTVRGQFDQLGDAQRAALLAAAGDHDALSAAFTTDGTLTYDLAARPFFAFRYLVELPAFDADEADDARGLAAAEGEALARAWLATRGFGYKHLRAVAEDVADLPLGARGRRESRRP
jgi:hypothetical protein